MVRRSGDCIMIAATLRHTAAAAAKVKSEIHMITDSLFLLSLRLILLERTVNAGPRDPFRELAKIFRYYSTIFEGRPPFVDGVQPLAVSDRGTRIMVQRRCACF
jgi:hypothetical protein